VTALEPTEVITLDGDALFNLMAQNPDLGARMWQRLAGALGERLRHSNDRYLSHVRTHDVADELLSDTGPLSEDEVQSKASQD
jgi:CRP-like cAMP-binding protein